MLWGASLGQEPVLKKGVGTLAGWCLEEVTVPVPPPVAVGSRGLSFPPGEGFVFDVVVQEGRRLILSIQLQLLDP